MGAEEGKQEGIVVKSLHFSQIILLARVDISYWCNTGQIKSVRKHAFLQDRRSDEITCH